MSDYIDQTHEAMARLRDCAMQLERMAHAFNITGNTIVCDELEFISGQIMESQKAIGDAMSIEINRSLKDVQDSTGRILMAMIDRETRNGNNAD